MTTLLQQIQSAFPSLTPETRDDGLIATTLSNGRTKVTNVKIGDIQAYLQAQGVWWTIKAAAATNQDAAAVMDVANARYDAIDTTLPIVGQMLTGLVTAGLLTAAQQTAITSMGVVPDPVSVYDVSKALEGVL
jgi:hypothetical protein